MKLRITEGMAIAFFPVIGFASALMFEMGYADAFDYSYELIDVDLKLMIFAMLWIALILAPFFAYCCFFIWAARRGGLGARLIAFQMVLPLPMLVGWYISGFQSHYFAMATIAALCTWIWPLAKFLYWWLRHNLVSAIEKLARSEGVQDKPLHPLKSDKISWYDRVFSIFMLAVLVSVLAVMARGAGSFVAHKKSGFSSFLSDGKEYAILSAYADRFVVGGVDGGMFDGNVYVFAKNSERLVNLRKKHYVKFLSRFEMSKESRAAMPPPALGW